MNFTDYKSLKLYKSHNKIYLPKSSDSKSDTGNVGFVISPSLQESIRFLNNPIMNLAANNYKKYQIDTLYKLKLHNTNINKNNKNVIVDTVRDGLEKLKPEWTNLQPGNKICDLSIWMNIFFSNDFSESPAIICKEFMNLFNRLILDDSEYDGWNKAILFDIYEWSRISPIILLNRKLLNNPFSIIIYATYYYPELLERFNSANINMMLVNDFSNEVFVINSADFTKDNISNIKTKMRGMTNIVFSIDESGSISDTEKRAELAERIKKDVLKISRDVIDNDDEDDTNGEETERANIIKDELIKADIDDGDVEGIVRDISSKVVTSFTKVRDDKTDERIKILLEKQEEVLSKPVVDGSIKAVNIGNYTGTTNPTLQSNSFINFTKTYNEKFMESDIDNAIAQLSLADDKIFVINKEVTDTSDTQNLKKTYKYILQDERGNKSTLIFDVPVIIDDNYIYINGSKKNIGHQYILKPLVKTGRDTVQLVTAYNKAFIRRRGRTRQITNLLHKYIEDHKAEFNVVDGNYLNKNNEFNIGLDLSLFSRAYTSFEIEGYRYVFDIPKCIEECKKIDPSIKVSETNFPIGYNKKLKKIVFIRGDESVTDIILNNIDPITRKKILSKKLKPKVMTTTIKVLSKQSPIILLMLFCSGFQDVMRRAKINYFFADISDKLTLDVTKYDYLYLEDAILYWERKGIEVELLMNGLKQCPMEYYSREDLEDRNTYTSLLMTFYGNDPAIEAKMLNIRDFMLDGKSKELLAEMGLPTELVDVLICASNMLAYNAYKPENSGSNLRIRSNEIIADIIYSEVTQAYTDYRKTSYKKKPSPVSIKPNSIIDELLSSDTRLITEFSTLNPILEASKARAITFKGPRGIQLDRAMTLNKRAYDPSMLGIVGISTSPDANVGVVRQLTTDPKIKNARGFLEDTGLENVESLNAANLFTPEELLSPIGVRHDDPDRTSMNYKQSKFMMPVANASPPLIGNGMETSIPYMLSDEFVITAKDDGKVIYKDLNIMTIQYKDGTNKIIDISERIKKNAAYGKFLNNTLITKFKVGDAFKKGEVIASNEKFFSKNTHINAKKNTVNLNQGVFAKVASMSNWDVYEDSGPCTKKLAYKLGTEMIDERVRVLSGDTVIDYICNVGDIVNTGDKLLTFSEVISDEMKAIFHDIKSENDESFMDSAKNSVTSKFSGEVVDIKIYSTIPVEDMEDSLAKLVTRYRANIESKNKTIDKFANKGDSDFYVAGMIKSEVASEIEVPQNGKIKGNYIDKGVMIVIYVRYVDIPKKGDKSVVNYALKNIISRVIPDGEEPYTINRPDEEISAMIAPLAISARKVPSVFLLMFGNKNIIEMKRKVRLMYTGEEVFDGSDY